MTTAKSEHEIATWLIEHLAAAMGVSAEEVDPDQEFVELGLGSRTLTSISGKLQKWLGVKLAPTLLFEHPTVTELAAHLAKGGR